MTKAERIRMLYAEGVTSQVELMSRAGASMTHVGRVLADIRRPGSMIKERETWRQKHPKYRAKSRKKLSVKYRFADQAATVPSAKKRWTEWTPADRAYLEMYGLTKTILQIALDLNRTYHGVRGAGQRYNIDLGRKEKSGANGNSFKKSR